MKPRCGLLRTLAVLAGVSSLSGAVACGPSFQAIYEGNARFEHCYALEENAQRGLHEKADCWRDWSEHYTYGQTRDRIHYATARYVALSQSTNVPTDEAMMMAAPGVTPRQTTITAPAPTNAFAPPPKVLDDADSSAKRHIRSSEASPTVALTEGTADAGAVPLIPVPVPEPAPLPGAACTDACAGKLRDCESTCGGAGADAGKKAAGCMRCEKSYRGCMRGCFK